MCFYCFDFQKGSGEQKVVDSFTEHSQQPVAIEQTAAAQPNNGNTTIEEEQVVVEEEVEVSVKSIKVSKLFGIVLLKTSRSLKIMDCAIHTTPFIALYTLLLLLPNVHIALMIIQCILHSTAP